MDRQTGKQVSVGGAQACVGFQPLQVDAPGVTLSRALGVHLELMVRTVMGTTDCYCSRRYIEGRAISGSEGTSESFSLLVGFFCLISSRGLSSRWLHTFSYGAFASDSD